MSEKSSLEQREAGSEAELDVESRVVLNFMRHGKKEKLDLPDEEIPLTIQGKHDAWRKGIQARAHPEVAIALGGPRKRTRETSTHVMLGSRVAPHADLEEMEREIAKELKYGKKVMMDERLNFRADGPVGQEVEEAAKKEEYFRYLLEQSDQRAVETHDLTSTTLTRHAGNVAELIQKYVSVSETFHKLASGPDKKYEKYGNRLERYLGTHLGIQESFIVKVLEKLGEEAKRQAFIEAYPKGFKELQGMNIDVSTRGSERTIFLSYEIPDKSGRLVTERILLTGEVLEKIIEERYQFEQAVAEKE